METARIPVAAEHTGAERREVLERWKARLLVEGLRVTPTALAALRARAGGAITSHEYATTGGVTLDLGGEVSVNAPVDEWFCHDASGLLDAEGDALFLGAAGEDDLPVDYRPHLPGYLDAVDDAGRAVTDSCFSHGDRIRLSPVNGCAYRCDYCDLPSERYARRDVEQLLQALAIAAADTQLPPRHVMVSGGTPGPRHIDWFVETIHALTAAAQPLPLDVMMSAVPGRPEIVDRLVDGGVTGFAVNLELFGQEASELHIRGKHRKARPAFDTFVTAAVDRLGRDGAIRSLIITGLEPTATSLDGVAHIAALGADPVLSPFRPAERTSLVDRRPPDLGSTLDVLHRARDIASREGGHLGPDCIACQHNTLTLPWDVRSR